MHMETGKYSLSVVVPLYNEEGNVFELHRRIKEALEKSGHPYEIIFVDDGSKDKTRVEAEACKPMKLIVFRKNFDGFNAGDALLDLADFGLDLAEALGLGLVEVAAGSLGVVDQLALHDVSADGCGCRWSGGRVAGFWRGRFLRRLARRGG